jgi:uncharacterized peroxidase-related enzyme
MARIQPIQPQSASSSVKAKYEVANSALGALPNLVKTYGNSDAALGAFLGLYSATAESIFTHAVREQIALAVSQVNGCDYCLAIHTAVGRGAGLGKDDIEAARRGMAADARVNAAVKFAYSVAEKRGKVTDAEVEDLRLAGYSDKDIVDLVGIVILNFFNNFMNNVADTEIEFPRAAPLSHAG